ncbi:MAG: GntR family transcriptional regulator [Bacteroidales bacterium]|nr:MAG: GntR family transcriptional regulator [Bacteroidales bacterium]
MSKKIISVERESAVSKYKQIVATTIESISIGKLKVGDKMPSINNVCKSFNISRDTVLLAYKELKARGIISSAPGKGYYIETTNVDLTHKVFVLFDELNAFKENLYNSFLEELNNNVLVEIFFHHFNRKVFDSLLHENNGLYTTYVVMPAKFNNISEQLANLNGRVIILDQLPEELSKKFPSVYQNFEKDTYNSLMSGKKLISKYRKLIMIYPGGKEPEGQFKGFIKFCNETGISFELISGLTERQISKGEAYIAIWDSDLVKIITSAKLQGLEIGQDVGIISYNDTELKQVVANGITTISTDFKAMGKTLANLVLTKKNIQIENPASLIVRESL